jgi:hypothetical protein
MTVKPSARKLALTAHVMSSMTWLGAVAVFLVLALAGLTKGDAELARAAYLAMDLTTRLVIVPMALLSLASGVVMSLGTHWGLVRYYWVFAKFSITIVATLLLFLHLGPIERLAELARATASIGADVERLHIKLVGDAAVALLALLVNTALSVFKPWGTTAYGRRRKQQDIARIGPPVASVEEGASSERPRWVYVVGIHAVGLVVLLLVVHLTGDRAWHH